MTTAGGTTNLWVHSEHAQRYLAEKHVIPHRSEGANVLLELTAGTAPRRVLDLGTGDGETLALVLAAHGDAEGVGVDFQAEMVTRARDRFDGDGRVEIVEHDLDRALPFTPRSFDLVVSSFAIHHLSPARQRALYGEVFAVLEPGGRFANLEHVASPTVALHEEFLAALGRTPDEDDPSNQLVPLISHLEWLGELGFVDVDCFWKWRELALVSGVKPA